MLRGGGAVPWENINYKASFFFFSPSHFPDFTGKAGQTAALAQCSAPIWSRVVRWSYFSLCAVIEVRLGQLPAHNAFPGRTKLLVDEHCATLCWMNLLWPGNKWINIMQSLLYVHIIRVTFQTASNLLFLGAACLWIYVRIWLWRRFMPFRLIKGIWANIKEFIFLFDTTQTLPNFNKTWKETCLCSARTSGCALVFYASKSLFFKSPKSLFYLICAYTLPQLGVTTRNRLVQENEGGNVTHLRYNIDGALESVFQACPTHPRRSIIWISLFSA